MSENKDRKVSETAQREPASASLPPKATAQHNKATAGQGKSDTALREEEVLQHWQNEAIFNKTLEKEAPEGEFVFYDGPPFATGLPHWGSLLSSISKDVVGRYKTMRGYRVPRRWGWDCHGLPIENMVEKKLGLKSKKDILELGIDRFNEEARASVLHFADDWKTYVDRVGRWVDFDHSYKTMDNSYVESVWWGLKKIHDDGRLYEGRKVLMYCPHCETPLSKAEIAMDNSYKDVTDESVYVKFKIDGSTLGVKGDVFMLAWTTTPWTLPANTALAVGENITYVLIERGSEQLVVAKERLSVLGDDVTVVQELKGADLVSVAYEPLYEIPKVAAVGSKNTWTIVAADFVTTEDGTGVVHIAPMYGEDDYNLGVEYDLPVVPLLDATGTFNADAPELVQGMYFKKGGKYVTEDLEKRDLIFAKEPHTHSYPHCYRCNTALIYNALTSWFIDIQSVKKRMIEANEDINWYPEHLKHGRFQNIVETAPDWTISRNRFWASPLPIWKHENTDEVHVFGSLAELREHTKKSGNIYLSVRHGQAQSNVDHVISSSSEDGNHITDKGKEQIRATIEKLKSAGVTKIISSPILRTRETAELIADSLGYDKAGIEIEDRLREWQLGEFDGKPVSDLRSFYKEYRSRFTKTPEGGENLVDMKQRIGEALYEFEEKYEKETILIVGHEYTSWLAECVAQGADIDRCVEIRGMSDDYVANGEVRTLDLVPLPHNTRYELDLHRPYIDDLPLVASDGARLVRIPEVVDCWVESGAMPFAAEHYPHENKEVVKRRYPGDFIAEYIAQTRTWFYYMHALGVLLFDAPSFKNCVTTGNIQAADGAKMSKSKNNYTDPLADMDKYGADAARFYLLGSVVMAGEDVAFKDEELREAHNRFINMLWNSYKFYELHATTTTPNSPPRQPAGKLPASPAGRQTPNSSHVLDRWILTRLESLMDEITLSLDAYDTVMAARLAREFVTDLSTWYIRRSRDRFKSDNKDDQQRALATTRYVFLTLAKLVAPMTPFIAESVYQGCGGTKESVHMENWPEAQGDASDTELLADMAEARRAASLVLEARQRTGLKVRQPLAKVTLASETLKGKEDLLQLLAEEVNVKEVQFGSGFDGELYLDTDLTPELVQEGQIRELLRAVQALRKEAGLSPDDKVTLTVGTDESGEKLMEAAQPELERTAGVQSVSYQMVSDGKKINMDDIAIVLTLSSV